MRNAVIGTKTGSQFAFFVQTGFVSRKQRNKPESYKTKRTVQRQKYEYVLFMSRVIVSGQHEL